MFGLSCLLLKYRRLIFVKVYKKCIEIFVLLLLFCSHGRIRVKIIWKTIFWTKNCQGFVVALLPVRDRTLNMAIFGLEKP